MGWTSGHRSRESAISEEFSGCTIIARAPAARGVWLVWEWNGARHLGIALLEGGAGNVAIKVVDESMGPCEVDCPLPLLAMVPDNAGAYAHVWRQRVHAHWNDSSDADQALGSMVEVCV